MVTIKGSQIIVKTEKDCLELENKLAQIDMEYPSFVVATLTTVLNQEVVDPIQTKMRQLGVSEKVIERTYLDTKAEQNGRIITFHIKSDYISESGFPVAVIIEHGRKAYLVRPKIKKFLSWIKDGIRHFSRVSRIPEKAATNVIFDTIREGQPKVQKILNSKTKTWLSAILKS